MADQLLMGIVPSAGLFAGCAGYLFARVRADLSSSKGYPRSLL